jgi:hypothetical protein
MEPIGFKRQRADLSGLFFNFSVAAADARVRSDWQGR